jgi:DNA-directed RNA polymerase specialized sigma24 family protein
MPIVERQQNLRSIQTRRSLLPPPGAPEDPAWEQSWTYLFEAYAPAMERYVAGVLRGALKRPPDMDFAADIVQSYLAEAIEKGWLARDETSIQCFRAYLQTQLRRFTYKRLDHMHAAKRHAPGTQGDDALAGVLKDAADDIADLDQAFVDVAVERSLSALREANETYAEIVGDLLRTGGEGSADLAERLGRPGKQLPVLKHRATRRFGILLYEELRMTVRDEDAFQTLCQRLEPFLP